MRVALFFDGKNHMKDLRRSLGDRWIDHEALAAWMVAHVGGTHFFAAHYYTGVPNPQDEPGDRHALTDLLEDLEQKPGFFVHRFNRKPAARECPHCSNVISYTEEKMVDTSLVTDLVMLAVHDAYDIAVVFSGDLDVAPGLQAAHALGKKVWIATFGEAGLSKSLSRAAWGTVNLAEHLERFALAELTPAPERLPESPEEVDNQMLRELRRAQGHFGAGGGFVGAHYFIHRWKGHRIPDAPDLRRQSLQRLLAQQRIETYVNDGKTALRAVGESTDISEEPPIVEGELTASLRLTEELLPPVDPAPRGSAHPPVTIRRVARDPAPVDEDETVEVRLSDTMKRIRRQYSGSE
jgi:uncharacterized LabA/DUF88 family protein